MRLVIDPHILENAFYYGSSDHFELTQEMVRLLHAISDVHGLAQKAPRPKPRAKIFISYKSENRDWAEAIHFELEREGYAPWIDRSGLKGGDTWWAQIEYQISQATIFLPILSEWAANASGYHKSELDLAREKQRRSETFIIPFKVGDYELPVNLRWLERLHVVDSSGDWFGDLRRAVDEVIGHQTGVAALAEERERTCLCIDNNTGYPEIIRRYRDTLKSKLPLERVGEDSPPIEKFEKWKQILENYEAIRPKPIFTLGPALKAEIDGYRCRGAEDEVFVKVAVGSEGHLVSEKCRQGHDLAICPTAKCLCRTKPDRVLCARDVLNRLKDRRHELENLAKTWGTQSA
jgi:hypothetical protein